MAKKVLKFFPVFLMLVVIPSCIVQPVMNLSNEPVPTSADGSTYTRKQLHEAIIRACKLRGWIAQPKKKGLIEASINVRMHRAKVEIHYDETKISILYKDSYDLDYADGYIHRNYNRWITYLYRTILSELHSPT
ncbi:MAG: hypothetical protein CEE38_01555 [Planctomycetes bacterium B3_Pla]|nr:MAG: hypothetical protein CEE38_01555 [Planctomycetes bacterium B3_Pla]